MRLRVIASSLLWLSCSPIDSAADVTLDGTLQRQDRTAAASLRTVLVRIPDPLELITQGVSVITSVGLACLGDNALPICKTVQLSTTDAQGKFHYMMKGRDVKGSLGQVALFDLAARLDNTGPSVQVGTFSFLKEMLVIPTARFWEPANVSVSVTSAQATVSWDTFGASHGREPMGGYQVRFSADGGADVWSQRSTPGSTLDARALEDAFGTFSVAAGDKLEEFDVTYRSKLVGWSAAGNPRPVSRGKGCLVAGETGALDAGVPCPISSGVFGDRFVASTPCAPDAGSCMANRWLQLDLGAAMPVSAVFTHGLSASGKIAIQTSLDGMTFSEVARADRADPFFAFTLPPAMSARYVRLYAVDGSLYSLDELSVW